MKRPSLLPPGGSFWLPALVAVLFASILPTAAAEGFQANAEPVDLSPGDIALRVFGCAVLLAGSALCSGLTLGVMGLDTSNLEILQQAGSAKERVWAEKILTVRRDGNLLLCTLLWMNMGINSLFSIVIADLTTGLVGFLVSTPLIVILGEIIPQASCQRHGLRVGAFFVPVVRVLIFLCYPLARPVAWCLDKVLGAEIGTLYNKQEFQSLLTQHLQANLLHPTEAAIMSGALNFRDKLVRDVCTSSSRMFALRSSDVLDYATMAAIYRTGYSRIPVWNHDRTAIIGLLYAKDLILISPASRIPLVAVVHFFRRESVNVVEDEDTLEAVLRIFSSSRQHFAIVRTVDASGPGDPVYKIGGIITMEDILETIIKSEIADEYDALRGDVAADAAALAASQWHGGPGEEEAGSGTTAKALAARLAREEAALRRLREVFGDVVEEEEEAGLEGAVHLSHSHGHHGGWTRGANNRLSGAEIRALAAHLLANVPAFNSSADTASSSLVSSTSGVLGGGGLSFEAVENLLRHCDIQDFTAPPAAPPPGLGRLRLTGEKSESSSAANSGGSGALGGRTASSEGANTVALAAGSVGEGSASISDGSSSSVPVAITDPSRYGADMVEAKRRKERERDARKAGIDKAPVADGPTSGSSTGATLGGGSAVIASTASDVTTGPSPLQWVYTRGAPAGYCIVVLEGTLSLQIGSEGIESTRGPWQVLGDRALRDPAYRPDYSACPVTSVARCLIIRREDFQAAREGVAPPQRRSAAAGGGGDPTAISSNHHQLHMLKGSPLATALPSSASSSSSSSSSSNSTAYASLVLLGSGAAQVRVRSESTGRTAAAGSDDLSNDIADVKIEVRPAQRVTAATAIAAPHSHSGASSGYDYSYTGANSNSSSSEAVSGGGTAAHPRRADVDGVCDAGSTPVVEPWLPSGGVQKSGGSSAVKELPSDEEEADATSATSDGRRRRGGSKSGVQPRRLSTELAPAVGPIGAGTGGRTNLPPSPFHPQVDSFLTAHRTK